MSFPPKPEHEPQHQRESEPPLAFEQTSDLASHFDQRSILQQAMQREFNSALQREPESQSEPQRESPPSQQSNQHLQAILEETFAWPGFDGWALFILESPPESLSAWRELLLQWKADREPPCEPESEPPLDREPPSHPDAFFEIIPVRGNATASSKNTELRAQLHSVLTRVEAALLTHEAVEINFGPRAATFRRNLVTFRAELRRINGGTALDAFSIGEAKFGKVRFRRKPKSIPHFEFNLEGVEK